MLLLCEKSAQYCYKEPTIPLRKNSSGDAGDNRQDHGGFYTLKVLSGKKESLKLSKCLG